MEAMLKLSSKLKEESPEETVGSKEDPAAASEDNQLQSTREEMGEVKEENERLKIVLARMVKDYQALQMRLFHVIHHDQDKKEENDLVSLSLGSSSRAKREEGQILRELKESGPMREDLSLSLKSRFNSSDNAMEGEGVAPLTKSTKMPRSEEDDLAQRNPAKNARVSIRARCDTPTMNDGCQWRKYGQKVAKGNPCPRGYYRCTVSSSCPVRKQVQRCAEDMSILITTYEGIHNHPLPAAATAMASTTAAAASMLMAGASVSSSSLSDNRQIYLRNPSISSYSSYPTITLDLTSPLSSSSSPPSSSYFNYNQQLGFFNHGRQAQEAQMQQLFLQRRASLGPSAPAQNPLSSSITAATKAITADPSFQSALAVAISSIVGEQGSRGSRDPLDQVKPSRFHVGGGAASFFTAPTLNSIQQQAKVVATKSGPPSSVDRGDELKR